MGRQSRAIRQIASHQRGGDRWRQGWRQPARLVLGGGAQSGRTGHHQGIRGTKPDGKADFDKLNQQWRSKEDEVARKITETKRKADGEAYAATESVAEYLAGDLGLKDATPTGYTRATANESEPTPTDIKQFTDMLEAGKVGLLVVNIQEETELTGKIVTAAKSSNIPIVELTEQMPEQYDSLTDWMAALVDAFSQAI